MIDILFNYKLDSGEPLYLQLNNIIKQLIVKGDIKEGELLPSEHEICDYFDISRSTVRQAFNLLLKDGYITRKRGAGTFVSERSVDSDLLGTHNYVLLEHRQVVPTGELFGFPELVEIQHAVKYTRLLKNSGATVAIETAYVFGNVAIDESVLNAPFDVVLADILNRQVNFDTQFIESTTIGDSEAIIFNSKILCPAFFIKSYLSGESGEILGMCLTLLRGDNYKIKFMKDKLSVIAKN